MHVGEAEVAPGVAEALDEREAKCFLFWHPTMPTLVIKSFPEELHAKLKLLAAAHRRSVTQETIHLLETALSAPHEPASVDTESYWATRKLIPEWEAALSAGAFRGGTDSTAIISEERDSR